MNKFCRNNTTFVYVNLGQGKGKGKGKGKGIASQQQVMKDERSDGMLGYRPYCNIRHNQDGKVVSSALRTTLPARKLLDTRFC